MLNDLSIVVIAIGVTIVFIIINTIAAAGKIDDYNRRKNGYIKKR